MKNRKYALVVVGAALALFTASCGANKKLLMENQGIGSELQASRARGDDLERQLGDTRANLAAVTEELEALDLRLYETEEELAAAGTRLESDADELDALGARLTAVREELQKSFAENESLERTVRELTDDMRASGNEMAKRIAVLTKQRQDLEKQAAALKNELGQSSGQNEALGVQVGRLTATNESLEAQSRDLRAALETATRRNEQQSRAVEGYRKTIEKQASEIEALKTDLLGLEGRIAAIEQNKEALLQQEEMDKARLKKTYEDLLASLESEVGEKTIQIENFRDALTINIMDQIFFDSGKAAIKKDGLGVLDRIAAILANLPEKIIRVEGHTDDVPIGPKIKSVYPSNWELASARSSAVARYFIDKHRIDPARVVAISYSQYRPLVPNTTEENRARNRRIEIVLTDRSLYELIELGGNVEGE
jgi:chemotaxis protein MotB